MNKIFAIALNYVRLSLRSPISVIMAFVMPVVYTAVLGAAFGSNAPPGNERTPLLVINEDGGVLAQQVIGALLTSEVLTLPTALEGTTLASTRQQAIDDLSEYRRVLVLPVDFTQTLMAARKLTAQLYVADRNERSLAVERAVQTIFTQLEGAVRTAKVATEQAEKMQPFVDPQERTDYFNAAYAKAQERLATGGVTIKRELAIKTDLTNAELMTSGAEQSSPGSLVNFGLINLLSCAIVLVNERINGTLRRLVSSPARRVTILLGSFLGPVIMGVLQTLLLVGVGQFVFGVNWGRSPLALALVAFGFILAGVSIGLFISTVVRTSEQATSLMIGASMGMAALGGAWWPIDITPKVMQQLGHFFPSAWAMDGFQNIILRGASVGDVITPVLVLIGFALVFFLLGVWRFRFE